MAAEVNIAGLAPDSAGQRLKRAREASGKTLAEISAATKIPERLLTAIEDGRCSALPSRIYAIGFARSYARLVGLDEEAIVSEIRAELDGAAAGSDIAAAPAFAPGDPARVPDRRLVLAAALGAVAVIVAGTVFWHGGGGGSAGSLPSILPADAPRSAAAQPAAAQPAAAQPAAAPAPPADGTVAFSALADGIWVKIYEATGRVLLERQMALGQTFAVPADARAPLIWTGRPDALAITIAGRPVAKLSDTQKIVKGVPISAAALLARAQPPAAPAQAAASTAAR